VKLVLTHSEHLKIFIEIQSHLEIESERLKMLDAPNMALVAKRNRPRGNKNNRGKQFKKGSHPRQKGRLRAGIAKKQKAKGNGEKNIVRVKCYNSDKKDHYARGLSRASEGTLLHLFS